MAHSGEDRALRVQGRCADQLMSLPSSHCAAIRGSLWLLPEAAARARYRRVIGRLAAVTGSAAFSPHVTLLGRLTLPPAQARDRLAALARALPPLLVVPEAVRGHSEFFRFLVLDLRCDAGLRAARAAAEAAFDAGPRCFAPHLSLAYAAPGTALPALPAADRLLRPFRLTHLAWTSACAETPVRDWRCVATRALRGG
jgi:hypothetical protein